MGRADSFLLLLMLVKLTATDHGNANNRSAFLLKAMATIC